MSLHIAMYGKALGNGYAITAIVGKKEVMESAQNTFISSTFWTERIGYASALATLNEMKKRKSWNTINKNGNYIIKNLKQLSKKHNLQIKIQALPVFLTGVHCIPVSNCDTAYKNKYKFAYFL